MKYEVGPEAIVPDATTSMDHRTRQEDETPGRSRVRVIHGLNYGVDGRPGVGAGGRCRPLDTAKARGPRYNRRSQADCPMRLAYPGCRYNGRARSDWLD